MSLYMVNCSKCIPSITTNQDMLIEMRSTRGFHAFSVAKVQRMFHLSYNDAYRWIDWLIETGAAERIEGRSWEVRLI